MASKVKEKSHQLLPKDEIKCHELINNFRKTINLWFLYGDVENTILKEVLNSCFDVILHGLKNQAKELKNLTNITAINYDSSPSTSNAFTNVNKNNNVNSDLNLTVLHKIIDDFEWVRNAVIVRRNSTDTSPKTHLGEGGVTTSSLPLNFQSSQIQRQTIQTTIKSCVTQWLTKNLSEQNLCAFMQYLISDKELLEEHYYEEALLRQKKHVTSLVIGLTAFETHQYGLLTQIERKQHKRSNSQPNVIVLTKTKPSCNEKVTRLEKQISTTSTPPRSSPAVLLTIRKTKSLPELTRKSDESQDIADSGHLRPRCTTIGVIKGKKTTPQKIPQMKISQAVNITDHSASQITNSSSSSFLCDYEDNQPTTSQASSNRSKSPLSNCTLNSAKSNASSSMSTSVSSSNSTTTTRCIQIINTDDIKIWTDQTWELKQKNKQQKQLEQQQQQSTAACAIPTTITSSTRPAKSLSPLNSFFSSLFNTPPSYTSWFMDHDSQNGHETTETAIESIIPDNNHHSVKSLQQQSSLSMSSTVFDKFLPIDGKKLRSRKSQNLFEDVNTTLDYTSLNMLVTPASDLSTEASSTKSSPGSSVTTPKNCQSLTRFLQMSHLSSHNTELEKENAHFRISEAIISAIERIKWNKLESQKDKQCRETTPLATDCLALPDPAQSLTVPTTSGDIFEGEHVPYAELEEVSYDLLSAEVVGLSLISKFDEKHLPKVSELKWLISDDDTPQKLLPMPDLTSSSNPDDQVVHSATRGTKYWAPPRQQIIFTDHPQPNRKELLKKQNYRCAGCGMRVSPQHMQSFRYCTYLGKYNCTGCHRNQISATPAKILQAWDFKCYPVSVFAYRLLEQMYAYPLFYVPDLNPALYYRSKSLLSARSKRLHLKFVKDFIRMCRFALREQSYFESIPDYITADIDNWSMSDFIDARTKCLQRSIDELINKCENHIFNCVLCTARGFLCECCHADIVIYPWDSRVERCDHCGTCFHRSCWKSMSKICCRCQRFEKRQDEMHHVI